LEIHLRLPAALNVRGVRHCPLSAQKINPSNTDWPTHRPTGRRWPAYLLDTNFVLERKRMGVKATTDLQWIGLLPFRSTLLK
jgi:hypothetical protein